MQPEKYVKHFSHKTEKTRRPPAATPIKTILQLMSSDDMNVSVGACAAFPNGPSQHRCLLQTSESSNDKNNNNDIIVILILDLWSACHGTERAPVFQALFSSDRPHMEPKVTVMHDYKHI